MGLSWVSWVLKNYELILIVFAEFQKIKLGFSWVFWVSITLLGITEKVYGRFLNLKIISWL